MVPELHTKRLLLRPLCLDDAEQVQQIFPQWEIVKFLKARVPWPYPPDGALSYYRDVALPAIERGDEWHWTLRMEALPQKIIGGIGLKKGDQPNRGFWLAPAWQNQGLMTEAAIATNDHWFDELGFDVLRAHKADLNVASRRVSEKTGMRLIAREEHDYVCGRLPTEVWEITAAEWREWRNQKTVR